MSIIEKLNCISIRSYLRLTRTLVHTLTFRCNNILYMRGVEEEEEDGEMKE